MYLIIFGLMGLRLLLPLSLLWMMVLLMIKVMLILLVRSRCEPFERWIDRDGFFHRSSTVSCVVVWIHISGNERYRAKAVVGYCDKYLA